jgi:DNA-directed RNA polymerase subunit M/transcription elongation factor TFIIS
MQQVDQAAEYLRVREHYRSLTDGELLVLARQASELTDVAQQALAGELSSRRLKAEPDKPAATSRSQPPPKIRDPNDPYDEDRRLVTIRTVWSLADALKLQNLLDTAGIPFYIGPEKATGVDAVTSNFADGLDFQIMSIGVPWATQAMQNYFPADDRAQEPEDELDEASVRCPRCHSSEVILEEVEPVQEEASLQRFKWTCDACGSHWEDNGIEAE